LFFKTEGSLKHYGIKPAAALSVIWEITSESSLIIIKNLKKGP
jgi:hypothetical protein